MKYLTEEINIIILNYLGESIKILNTIKIDHTINKDTSVNVKEVYINGEKKVIKRFDIRKIDNYEEIPIVVIGKRGTGKILPCQLVWTELRLKTERLILVALPFSGGKVMHTNSIIFLNSPCVLFCSKKEHISK